MKQALNTYLDEPEDSQHLAALPKKSMELSRSVVKVPVDPALALAFSTRRQRVDQNLS
jgi:hypothetical protein